ncbi:MAG: ATP-dependent DNA helicase [Candidatus Saccharimonadales bacterium]
MGNYTTEFNRLNAAQQQAVELIDGPLMVIAGPGTGKTQLLSMRVANILQKTDTNPANILCLTFTEAAARNMRERLNRLIGEPAYHVGIYTFHGFGSDIIQRYPEYFAENPLVKSVEDLGAYEILLDIFSKLTHDNPLRTKLGSEYFYLKPVQDIISWLKQAGLEPEDLSTVVANNNDFINFANPLVVPVMAETPKSKSLNSYIELLSQLSTYGSTDNTLAQMMTKDLATAIDAVDQAKSHAKTITAWRKQWLRQDDYKHWVMADKRSTRLLGAVAEIYQQYQVALAERGWYTYDDMILRTIKALQDEPELRLMLQEQYQYLMVDEYQDTNGAQNKLLDLLANNPVHEGRPNVMVVGDDDQAIYRFQGAQLSVMLDFLQRWRDVKQIVLDQNYRSGLSILDLARAVIIQGEERLESQVEGISKQLSSGQAKPPKATVNRSESLSELDHYAFVADSIAELIKNGSSPKNIAVLAPRHKYLQQLVPYLIDRQVPIAYDRKEHILDQPKIIELLNLAALVNAAAQDDWSAVDVQLSAVLDGEYWQIDPLEVWNISIEAHKTKQTWLEIMMDHPNDTVRQFAQALPVLSQRANTVSLDQMLDILIGNKSFHIETNQEWKIPYRDFYFSNQRLEANTQEYFILLGQLTTLRERLREYQPGQPLDLSHLMTFVNLYRQQKNLNLLDTNPHVTTPEAVELMTAYKAKGLEWDNVFVIACQDEVWGSKVANRNSRIGLPHNLSWIKPARDSLDDRLRLFYVALTRAKQTLYLTSFQQNSAGKASQPLIWLNDQPAAVATPKQSLPDLIHSQELDWGITAIQKRSLLDSLQPFLDNYQLSATHFNSFLDLRYGGPQHFFFRHVLYFPEAANPSSSYGTAMHSTLSYLHGQFTKNKTLPALAQAQHIFKQHLAVAPLLADERVKLYDQGKTALQAFYQHGTARFASNDKSEYSFKNEGVMLGSAKLNGTLDVLREDNDKTMTIIDYKTGKTLTSWQTSDSNGQIKAHLYKQQLAFYQLLVEGSAHHNQRTVKELAIQFLDPDEDGKLIYLPYQPTQDELQRLKNLIAIVWQHITDLNFPDTSHYGDSLKGIKQFQDDLLDGTI